MTKPTTTVPISSGAIRVEKGIPLPKLPGPPALYPWATMDVGDSFFAAGKKAGSLSTQASKAGKDCGRKFSLRAVEGGARVWRVA